MDKLERLELPNQMVAALDDPLMQKYILLTENETCTRRMNHWLALFLDAQLKTESSREDRDADFREVLEKVLTYTRATKVCPPECISQVD